MRKRHPSVLHVSPDFKRLIKAGASLSGKTIMDFTEDLSQDDEVISEYLNKKKDKQRGASFGFKI